MFDERKDEQNDRGTCVVTYTRVKGQKQSGANGKGGLGGPVDPPGVGL